MRLYTATAMLALLLLARLVSASSAATLHWIRGDAIERGIEAGVEFSEILFATTQHPNGIALDRQAGLIYWTSPTGIKRSRLDGKDVETVVPSVIGTSLIVDHAGGRLYWAQNGVGLRTALLDGSNVQTIAARDMIGGIAVDKLHGKIYWTENSTRRIERANSDGSDPEPVYLMSEPQASPYGLAIDPTEGRVYWADFGRNEIRAVYFNGALAQAIYDAADGVHSPYDVGFDPSEKTLYWSEHDPDRIQKGGTNGVGVTPVFSGITSDPYAIVVEVSGDFNGDGVVAGNDLEVFREAAFFDPFTLVDLRADTNVDGISDGADLLIWQRTLATNSPVHAVPEPESVRLVVLITSFAFVRVVIQSRHSRCGRSS